MEDYIGERTNLHSKINKPFRSLADVDVARLRRRLGIRTFAAQDVPQIETKVSQTIDEQGRGRRLIEIAKNRHIVRNDLHKAKADVQ